MIKIPDHKLPMNYFDVVDNKKQFISPVKIIKNSNPKKKMKSSSQVHQSMDISCASSQKPKKKQTTSSTSNSGHSLLFRQIDTDVLLLLKVSSDTIGKYFCGE